MNLIYYDVLMINYKPVNEERISTNTAMARFKVVFLFRLLAHSDISLSVYKPI